MTLLVLYRLIEGKKIFHFKTRRLHGETFRNLRAGGVKKIETPKDAVIHTPLGVTAEVSLVLWPWQPWMFRFIWEIMRGSKSHR